MMRKTRRKTGVAFDFKPYSRRQLQAVTWWMDQSPYNDRDTLIADGSIRSGKTVAMIDGFTTWTMAEFKHENFILAGRSIGALKRNVIGPMRQILNAKGIDHFYHRSENFLEIGTNTYYMFGANNEAAQDVMQGLTAAGAYADDGALFPRSFIEQMIGRCSVDGARIWINCNPQGPYHYLKTDYIDQADKKGILRLQFTLDDNLTLPESTKRRYKRMFSGVFYQRNILGQWVMAEGVIYDMFDADRHVVKTLPTIKRTWVASDYGTSNATVFLLLGEGVDGCLYVMREWSWSGREKGRRLTDAQLSQEYRRWIVKTGATPARVWVDPSAASFVEQLYQDGVKGLRHADNSVLDGIQDVSTLLGAGRLKIHESCTGLIKEFGTYVWDGKAQERGDDKPVEKDDHHLDALRYGVRGTKNIWRRWVATATKEAA